MHFPDGLGSSSRSQKNVRRPLENLRVGLALIFRPCLPRHGQTPARRLRSAGKRTLLESRTRLRWLTIQEILDEQIAKKLV
jgi:hypothetical protein